MSVPDINELKDGIPKRFFNDEGCMNLENSYSMTVAELGLQQTKRDQILALYLTILGFVIPSIINLEIHDLGKAFAFIALYFIGMMLCHVILRYRIYKEVYWIACRVISQLYNIKPAGINSDVIHTLYYHALEKNMGSIVRYKRKAEKKGGPKTLEQRSIIRSFIHQLNSAETLLFEILVIFSTAVGSIGCVFIFPHSIIGCLALAVFLLFMLVSVNYKYATKLMELYKCIDSHNPKDLLIPFKKAWMLECYIDDIPFEDDEE